MRFANEGVFVEPSDEEKAKFEMYEKLIVSDTDDELVIPHTSTATSEAPIIYHSPNFTKLITAYHLIGAHATHYAPQRGV